MHSNPAGDRRTKPTTQKRRLQKETAFCVRESKEEISVLCRPGSDLLSQGLSHSTIGAEEFNGRVRNGIGLRLFAKTTRPAKDRIYEASIWFFISYQVMQKHGH